MSIIAKIAIGGCEADATNTDASSAIAAASRHEPKPSAAVSATEAKNEFGRILETVIRGGKVVITKHDSPKAVLISIDEFNALSNARQAELETLSEEFDQMLAQMQTPAARAGMDAAFHATPKELGRAARAAARKRG